MAIREENLSLELKQCNGFTSNVTLHLFPAVSVFKLVFIPILYPYIYFMLNFTPGGGGVLPIMAFTGRLRPKGVPFSGFRYIKG